jgi:hypothetical protein
MKPSSSVTINLSIQAAVQNLLPALPFTQFIMVISQNMYGPGVNSASKRNENQMYFLGIKVAGV